MFTSKDIEVRTIMVVDCTEGRSLHVRNGELLLSTDVENKTLTKLPFQKILALFIIGRNQQKAIFCLDKSNFPSQKKILL